MAIACGVVHSNGRSGAVGSPATAAGVPGSWCSSGSISVSRYRGGGFSRIFLLASGVALTMHRAKVLLVPCGSPIVLSHGYPIGISRKKANSDFARADSGISANGGGGGGDCGAGAAAAGGGGGCWRCFFSLQGWVDSKGANLPGLLLSCRVIFSSFPTKDGVKSSTQDLHAAADCKSNFLSLFGLFVAIVLSTINLSAIPVSEDDFSEAFCQVGDPSIRRRLYKFNRCDSVANISL